MVLESVFPQDERVEKEIASLTEEGHEVRIATYSFTQSSSEQLYQNYVIYRRRISKLMYKLGAAILIHPFYFNFWRRYLKEIFRTWNFDALHIHDLPLTRLGSEYKRKHRILFVADQHEFYSSWIVKTAHYNSLPGRVIRFLSNWKAYEGKHLRQADLVCTVEEPLREMYIRQYGLDPLKVIIIPNTPRKSVYDVEPGNVSDDHFNLFYCGGLDRLRGLDTAIRALPLLRERIPEVRLVLTGRKNKYYDPRRQAAVQGVEDLLELREWVDYRELPHEIDLGDVCFFIPPADREEIHNTIATKIYQYMARGKPVVVGSARYMKEFVEKHGIGITVDETSPREFADAVLRIYTDGELRKRFSENSKKTIREFYWEKTIMKLLDFYRTAGQDEVINP